MADKDNKSKLTYHVWDKDNNEYDIPDEVVQQRGMDNFAKDFEGGYITMFDDKKQKVDVPIEDVEDYRKQGYLWYDTSGNATPINEIGKETSVSEQQPSVHQPQANQGNGLISKALGFGENIMSEAKKAPSMISSMFGGSPKSKDQIEQNQQVDGVTGAAMLEHPSQFVQTLAEQQQNQQLPRTDVQQRAQNEADIDAKFANYVEDWKKRPDKESGYFPNFVADLEADGMNPDEALQVTRNALNRYANRSAQDVTNKVVSSLSDDTVQDAEKNIEFQWYSHPVQDQLKQEAATMGISYDDYVAHYLKPAMVESLVKKYGPNYRNIAEGIATRLYSHEEHVQDRLMNQDINDALSDVISKYTSTSVAKAIQDAEAASNAQMAQYNEQSRYVDSASPFSIGAISEANKTRDPQKVLGDLQKKFGKLYQNPQFLNDMSNEAFKVMQRYGLHGAMLGDPKQFKPMINAAIKNELDQLEVKGMLPKGSTDYILKTGIENTIIGKVSRKIMQTDYQNWLEDIANQQYQPGFWERVGSGALTFAGDAWSYWLPGAAGGKLTKSMIAKAEGKLASDLMAKGMETKMAERAAKVLIGKSKGIALKTGAASGAATFGGQSAISKPVDEIYRTGQFDEKGKVYNPSVGKVIANTLGEVAKQSTVGAIMQGGTIANMIGKGRGLATNILADLGGKAIDSSIMAGQQTLERMAQDPSFKPTGKGFAESALESMANLVSIGLPGMVGKYARFKDAKEFNRKYDFNDQDIADLRRFGYDGLHDAFEKMGIGEYAVTGDNAQRLDGQLTQQYMNMMNDKSVPETLKAKMMAVVEGKRPSSFSPVVDSTIQPMDNGGKVYLETLNKDGGVVDRKEYSSYEEAQKADKKLDYEKTLGLASVLEGEFHNEFTQEHLDDLYNQAAQKYNMGEKLTDEEKAAVYLRQNAGAINNIMQKRQQGMILTDEEQKQVEAYRHFYDSALENSSVMREFVNTFEDSHGVARGTLRKALESKDKKYEPLVESYLKELYNSIELKREMKQTMDDLYNTSQGRDQERLEQSGVDGENAQVEANVSPSEPPTPPVADEGNSVSAPYQDRTNSVPSPSDAEFANNASNTNNESQTLNKASDAYVMGQTAYKNGDNEGLKAISHNADVAELRLQRAFEGDENKIKAIYKAIDEGKDMDQYVQQRVNYLTPVQQEAIHKYAEAMDAKKGVMDSVNHADDGYAENLKEQLWPYATEDGNIVPVTLDNGKTAFLKKSNEYGGAFVTTTDETGQPVVKQVSSAQIKETGNPVPFDDYVSQIAAQHHAATIQKLDSMFDGSDMQPGQMVDIAMEPGTDTMQMQFAGYTQDGKIVLSDGQEQIALSKDEFSAMRNNALRNTIDAELDAEDAQRANEEAQNAETSKQERYKKGIFGYAAGQPDYSDPQTDPKVAAEYLQETAGNDRKALFSNISAEKQSLQTRINQLREHIANNDEWLSINADLDPKNAETRTLANKQMKSQIADLQARFDNWNKIRSAVMTPEEATAIKNDRTKKIAEAGVNESDIKPIEGREVAVLTDEELKKQYPTMDEASTYITSERKRIYHIQSDEVQREIDGVDDVLNRYVDGVIDLEPEQIKELNTTKAQLQARQQNLTESAKELKAQADKLKTLYKQENMKERAEALENMTPAEQRAVKVENAIKNSNLNLLNTIYDDVRGATDFNDTEPNTIEEYVANNIGRFSINYEGKEKGGAFSNGLQQETGLSRKDFDKIQILAKKGEGNTVPEFVHSLYDNMPEHLKNMGYNDQDIRDAFLKLILGAESYSDIKNYTLNNKVADAEQKLQALEQQEAAMMEEEGYSQESDEEIEPVGVGPFGNIYNQFVGKPAEAIAFLIKQQGGEALGALHHDSVGDIDLVWGDPGTKHSDGYGLAKLVKYHPEVVENLQEILNSMKVDKESPNRVNLSSDKYKAGIRLDYDGKRKTWLLTDYEKEKPSDSSKTTDTATSSLRGDTALSQSEGSSIGGKDTNNSDNLQENSKKFSERLQNAIAETETAPTEAQKKAGNYKKGHLSFGGYDFTIETPKGATRSGKDEQGKPWSVTMHDTYGYILGKIGVDGDHIDMFINDNADLDNFDGNVYVVDQVNPETGEFDEHKVMYGYPSEEDATEAYLANYSKGWKGLGKVTTVPKVIFDKWLDSSDRKTKPFSEYIMIRKELMKANSEILSLLELDNINKVHPYPDDKVVFSKLVERLLSSKNTKDYKSNESYSILSSTIDAKKLTPYEYDLFKNTRDYYSRYRNGVFGVDHSKDMAYEIVPKYKNEILTSINVRIFVPQQTVDENLPFGSQMNLEDLPFNRDVKEVKPKDMTEPQKLAFGAVSTMLKKAGIPVKVISNEDMEKVAEAHDNLVLSTLLNSPVFRFQIKTPEQKAAAKAAYDWAVEHRPDKWSQYAIVNMDNPNQMPEYFQKQSLAEKWRKYYTNQWRIGNYKGFNLNKPFEEQIKNVVGKVPNEFDPYKEEKKVNDKLAKLKKQKAELVKQRDELQKQLDDYNFKRNKTFFDAIMDYRSEHPGEEIPDSFIKEATDNSIGRYDPRPYLDSQIEEVNAKIKANNKEVTKLMVADGGGISFMRTYHGSGADFDEFDFDHMSEGAGSQAFGWGGYVTSSKDIGKSYAEVYRSGVNSYQYKGKEPLTADEQRKMNSYMYSHANDDVPLAQGIKEKMAFNEKMYKKLPNNALTKEMMRTNTIYEKILPKIENGSITKKDFEKTGKNLYQVEIPDDNGKNYLDWDKKLSREETAKILEGFYGLDSSTLDKMANKDAVFRYLIYHIVKNVDKEKAIPTMAKSGILTQKTMFDPVGMKDDGASVYHRLTNWFGSPKEASKFLSSVGFTGIKYYAGRNFGGAKEGDTNYVIFNPSDMQIVDHDKFAKHKGTVYGYTDGNEIVLNQEHLNPNTPIHEYQHIWRTAAKEKNPDLIAHGDKLIMQTTLFADLKNDPNYSHLSDDALCDEAFARLTGDEGEAILEQMAKDAIKENPLDTAKELSIINRLKKWLKQFWYWTLETFTKWKPEDIKKMTLQDIRNLVLRDLAKGVDPRKVMNGQLTKDEVVSSETAKENGEKLSFEQEKKQIIAAAKSDGTYMLAPNGKKTKLDADQWANVRTSNFKKWFGDWEKDPHNASKVVDENGEPLVVYHGRSADFNTFEKKEGVRFIMGLEDNVKAEVFFFSPSKGLAEEFAGNAARHRGGEANVVACFLNIRKPMDLTGEDYDRIYEDVTGWDYTVGMDTQDNLWGIMDEEGMADKIKAKGYDGAIFVEEVNESYEPTKISYCALDANQIKSADNNNGEYSADNADIRFMFAGEKGAAEADDAEKVANLKQKQLDIINATNPMLDDYHTGIRKVNDIKTFAESLDEARDEAKKYDYDEWSSYPDVSNDMLRDASISGKITIYSSYPIKDGVFVTPSRMQAEDYAGGPDQKVYSKTVPVENVAWINVEEGQYAKVTKKSLSEMMEENEQGNRMANLKVAKKMERVKKDAKAIKMATGWERGADGKWRYEMPDAKIKDTKDIGGKVVKRFEDDMLWNDGKLEDAVYAPKLYEAYPQLKDVRINTDAIMNDMPSNGLYDPNTKTITIHADELKYLNKILNHEIQHAIQHIEGFAPGGTPDNVRKRVEEAMADLEDSANLSKDSLEEYKRINTHLVQLQCARQWEKNPKVFLKSSAKYTAPGYTPGTPKEEQIKIGQQLAEQWKQEANKFVMSRYYYRDSSDYDEKDNEKLLSKWSKQIGKQYSDDKETSDKFDKLDKALHSLTNYELYRALAGEVEARNVEHRMNMTPEARRASLASDTEDVPRVDQIVLNNAGASYRIVEEKAKDHPKSLVKAGTYFSGGGLVEEGLKGIIDPVVAVEYDQKISGVYRNNFGQHIVTADVRNVDPKELVKHIDGEVEYFHASPVCKNFSKAKANGTEMELDKETAKSTADFINAVKPRVVTIENVKGYRDSDAMKIITNALDKNGYKWDADVYNAADYGGYTNRERLIVRAVKDGKLPEKPKKQPRKGGWLEAVEDLIPTLTVKPNGVAPWMDTRLKADGIEWQKVKKPLYVMGSAYADGKIPHAYGDEKLPTLRTKSGDVIIMPGGKVLRADGRVLARVSGMSDDYKLPAAESLAHTIIGNGIPTQLTKAVIAPLLNKDNLSGRNILARLGKSIFKNHWDKDEQRKVADSIINTANQLGGAAATVYTTLDEVPDAYLSDVKKGATGWYDPETHTVHVYLPNCVDADEAQRTVFHEKIGHEGMEVLLDGEQGVRKFANFVYQSADKETRGKILDFANKYDPHWQNPDRMNVGAQEYIAHLAEDGPKTAEDFTLWTKIKHYLIKVLKKLGIRIPGLLNDKDLRYYLMKAGKALHVWDNMPKEKQETMMHQASNAEIKDALSDGAGKGKPRQKKGESTIQYMKRVQEWRKWKEAREDTEDPEPPQFYDFDKDAEGKKEWERLNKEWRDAHQLQGEEMPLRPERKEGETDDDFMSRYKEWEKWNNAIVDKENPMPDMFAFEKQKQDEARQKYEDWLTRHELNEQQQADLDLYEGKVYPAETSPEADILDKEVMQDLAEVTSTDVSKDGAARTVKYAVIHRRKNMEEASADDAIYINDVKNSIEKMAESGMLDKLLSDYQGKPNKAEKLAEAIPYIIEAPRRIREIANKLNATGVFGEGHIHITPNDVEAIQELRPELAKATADTHTEMDKNGKEVKVFDDVEGATEVASKVANIINGNHEKEPGFVPIDGTDILNKNVLPIVLKSITPYGVNYKELSEPMKSVLDSIRDWYNYTFDWLKDNNTLKADTGFTVDYVNHLWDKEKSDKQAYAMYVENRQRTKSPNEKPRQINTLMEGLDVGLVPKTTDITKMMAYYSRSNIEAWVNKTMLQELSGLNVIERNEDGEIVSSDPLLSSVAPFNLEQYKYFEIPGVGPVWVYNVSPKQVKVTNPITGKDKVLYSEASAGDRFGVVFDTYQSTPFWKFFDTAASSMKKLELGFSGFHAGALTEVYMVQNMTEFGPKKAMASFMKYIFTDTMKNHQLPCFANPDDFQEAATHLVKFGATNDYAAADVQNMFDNWRDFAQKLQKKLEERGKIGTAASAATIPFEVATQMVSMLNKGMDVMLWDFLHDGLKLASYRLRADRTKERAKKYGWTDGQLSKALDEDGQFVNDMFGGQHWDVLGASHRALRYAGRVLLSPDWNASTTRHFFALTGYGSVWNEATVENFKSYYKHLWGALRGKEELTPEDWGRATRQISALLCYGIGFMVFYEAFANAVSSAFRALDEEKEQKKAEEIRKTNPDYKSPYELAYPDGMKWYDYLMRGNTLGQQSKIFVGRYADGTEMYVRHGKQFREVPEYLFNHKGELEFPGPMVQRLIGKANPMVRMTLDDINYLSDFQASHADQDLQRKYGKTIGLLYKNALYWAPFLIPSQENKEFKAVDFFFPSSKGFSNWKAQDYFKNFILSGDMEGVMMTYQSCQRNGIDAEQQLQAAISSIKALESREMQDGVTSLQIATKRFDEAKSIAEKRKMREKMRKFLSQSEYKAFTAQEAMDMVKAFQEGVDPKEMMKADDKYLNVATSADVTEDWRIQSVKASTKGYADKLAELKDTDKAKAGAFKNAHANVFKARKAISKATTKMNKLKKKLGEGNDKAILQQIRTIRKDLLKDLNGMEHLKEYKE